LAKKFSTKTNISEVNIRLLPEKAKRDFMLRLVALIIVLMFVVINFFVIFLPRINLLSDANHIKRGIYRIEERYNNLQRIFQDINRELYDIPKNNDVTKIKNGTLDIIQMQDIIYDLQGDSQLFDNYIENIRYNDQTKQFTISIQFYTADDVFIYKALLENEVYFSEVKLDSRTNVPQKDGLPRVRAIFQIVVDPTQAPKVGDWNV
jgi:hypothetical protein